MDPPLGGISDYVYVLLNCVSVVERGVERGYSKANYYVEYSFFKFEKINELICCFCFVFYIQNKYRKFYKIFSILIYIKT